MTVREHALKILAWARERDFAGADPYDALNSPLAPALTLGTRYGRIALTQTLRRSRVDLRPALFVKPGVNPKAIALFLEGCVALGELATARELAQTLMTLRSPDASGAAWGYHFPWQNRFQLLPRYTPTIVNTAFAGHALLDYYDATHDAAALECALTAPDFILGDLNRLGEGDEECFSYTPLDRNFVHNANLLGASLLARIGVRHDRPELLNDARKAARYSARRQRGDGSWFYAERREQNWIDSFHTGFNLEALRWMIRLGVMPELHNCYRKGVDFYARHFFSDDATPMYYADRPGLVDIHAPTEAICFFSKEEGYDELTRRVHAWTLERMCDPQTGLFYFRKKGARVIRTPYMRWCEAWGFRALATLAATEGHAVQGASS